MPSAISAIEDYDNSSVSFVEPLVMKFEPDSPSSSSSEKSFVLVLDPESPDLRDE
jgi:hypothetical protein